VRARAIVACTTDALQGGTDLERLGLTFDAAIVTSGERIVAIGSEKQVRAHVPQEAIEIDARDCVVVPGFVDAHSHPLFAGNRELDFEARTRGAQPLQTMLFTIERTREALREPAAFYKNVVLPRLRTMLQHGTTTLETKTGYALTKAGELALLDLIASHREDPDIPRLVSTFLGAHALPPEFDSYDDYVDYLIAEVIPQARARGAIYADAFCEPGFFSTEQSRRYLIAAKERGLRARLHCDEMSDGGAARVAVAIGVDAVDHCNFVDSAAAEAIAQNAVLVSCPATVEFLGLQRRAPVRDVLERGGAVALASDFNPGTSPCFNLQTVAYFGRKFFGLSAAEALYGVTRAAAKSLRVGAGSLRIGGAADFVALQIEDPREFGWYFGGNLAKHVVKGGMVVGA
jgi:imidazolonepropionase